MNRKLALALFTLALASTVPALAAAQTPPTPPTENSFARGDLQFDASAMHLALEARGDVGEPRVRTESGFVRLWFPNMVGWSSLDVDGDGNAVRFIRVRPGADDTGVVVIRLGDGRRLPVGAVGVARAGNRVVISIARSSLPAVLEAPPAPQPAAAPVVETAAAAAAAIATTAVAETHDGEPRTAAEALAAGPEEVPATETTDAPTLGLPTPEGPSTLATLLGITTMLAAALGIVQWMRARHAHGAQGPSIRVVASTRLSPKQQLVVVRALGQDHLIALEPGRTERLLSIPATEAPRTEEDLVPELRLSRPGALAALPGLGAPAAASFGAELMRLVDKGTARGHAPTALALGAVPPAGPVAPAPANSDAVAGLVRLRAVANR